MTRRKPRSAPSSDEQPKTRRSNRKTGRNDDDDSQQSQENDASICVPKRVSSGKQSSSKSGELANETTVDSPRSKRGAKTAGPAIDSGTTRRSLRRPCVSVEDDEVCVPPVKKLRSRVSTSNSDSPSRVESDVPERAFARSDAKPIKNDVKKEKRCVKNSVNENDANSNKRQKSERTRKRKLADPYDDESSVVSNDSQPNCTNIDDGNESEDRNRTSLKNTKEENSKRRKISACVNQKADTDDSKEIDSGGLEKGDSNSEEGSQISLQTNGIKDVIEEDWSGWSEGTTDGKSESLFNRVWKLLKVENANNDSTQEDVQFSILTYNILAESLLKVSHYFENISPDHWNQQYRHSLLMKELAAIEADVFCLQEVERQYFQSTLSNDLSHLGYESIFACSETPGCAEGIAVCYRNSRFRVIAEKSLPLAHAADQLIDELNIPQENKAAIAEYVREKEMFQCVLLECRCSTRRVCIGNIHISYAKHKKPDLRCVQLARSIWEVATLLTSQKNAVEGEQQEYQVPFILCGDLNSKPDSAVYQLCRDGYLNDAMLNALQRVEGIRYPSSDTSVSLVNVLWKAFQHPIGNFRSSFFEAYNREPPLTLNLKGNRGCLDYVWFTQSTLVLKAVLPPRSISIKDLEDVTPNADFPSDHLSLAARFSFH